MSRTIVPRWLTSEAIRLVGFALAVEAAMLAIGLVVHAAVMHPDALDVRFSRDLVSREIRAFHWADPSWYMGIASEGYEKIPYVEDRRVNWVFFPLWPLVLRGLDGLFSEMIVSGMVLSSLLFLVSVAWLHALVRLDFPADVARTAVIALIVFPAAYFCWRPGPEALFVAAVIGSLWCGRTGRWVPAGVLAALATLTRPQGILLLLPLAQLCLRQYRAERRVRPAALALGLPVAALGAFLLYMRRITGNALASFAIQGPTGWDNGLSFPLAGIVGFLREPRLIGHYGWDLTVVSFVFAMAAIGLSAFLWFDRRFPREYLVYAVPTVYLIVSRDNLSGTLRYLLPVFPLFVALAVLVRQRPTLTHLVLCGFAALQAFYFVFFVQRYSWPST